MFDATNVRLRELSLGYNFPSAMMEKTGFINDLRISIIGRNLFFFQNETKSFDPDVTFSTGEGLQGIDVFSLPTTRTLGFNLSIGF